MQQQDPGIELLVMLAKNGEIDPWDVDIIVVTDKYLSALDRMEDRTLVACGKGIFYACVLLHMKARILAQTHILPVESPADDECYDVDDTGDDPGAVDLDWARVVSTHDGVLLLPRGRPRRRPISLDDLIGALRQCDEFEKKRRDAGLPPTSFFVATVHQDDVTGDVECVRQLLARFRRGSKPVSFHRLLGEGVSASSLFLALLFMAGQNEVSLTQKRFYGDLSIAAREVAL